MTRGNAGAAVVPRRDGRTVPNPQAPYQQLFDALRAATLRSACPDISACARQAALAAIPGGERGLPAASLLASGAVGVNGVLAHVRLTITRGCEFIETVWARTPGATTTWHFLADTAAQTGHAYVVSQGGSDDTIFGEGAKLRRFVAGAPWLGQADGKKVDQAALFGGLSRPPPGSRLPATALAVPILVGEAGAEGRPGILKGWGWCPRGAGALAALVDSHGRREVVPAASVRDAGAQVRGPRGVAAAARQAQGQGGAALAQLRVVAGGSPRRCSLQRQEGGPTPELLRRLHARYEDGKHDGCALCGTDGEEECVVCDDCPLIFHSTCRWSLGWQRVPADGHAWRCEACTALRTQGTGEDIRARLRQLPLELRGILAPLGRSQEPPAHLNFRGPAHNGATAVSAAMALVPGLPPTAAVYHALAGAAGCFLADATSGEQAPVWCRARNKRKRDGEALLPGPPGTADEGPPALATGGHGETRATPRPSGRPAFLCGIPAAVGAALGGGAGRLGSALQNAVPALRQEGITDLSLAGVTTGGMLALRCKMGALPTDAARTARALAQAAAELHAAAGGDRVGPLQLTLSAAPQRAATPFRSTGRADHPLGSTEGQGGGWDTTADTMPGLVPAVGHHGVAPHLDGGNSMRPAPAPPAAPARQ